MILRPNFIYLAIFLTFQIWLSGQWCMFLWCDKLITQFFCCFTGSCNVQPLASICVLSTVLWQERAVICVLTMFHLWIIDPGSSNLWIYFQLYLTKSYHISQLHIMSNPAELACAPVLQVSFFCFEMLLLFERLSCEIIVMMRLHLREPRTHWSYCEWRLCTWVAAIQGKLTTLTGPGAQRPLWLYNDFFFKRGIKAKVRDNNSLLESAGVSVPAPPLSVYEGGGARGVVKGALGQRLAWSKDHSANLNYIDICNRV